MRQAVRRPTASPVRRTATRPLDRSTYRRPVSSAVFRGPTGRPTRVVRSDRRQVYRPTTINQYNYRYNTNRYNYRYPRYGYRYPRYGGYRYGYPYGYSSYGYGYPYGYSSYGYGYPYGYGSYGYGGFGSGFGYGLGAAIGSAIASIPTLLSLSYNQYPPVGVCQIYNPATNTLYGTVACGSAWTGVPSGSWVLYRSASAPDIVHGYVVDPSTGQAVQDLQYDAYSGQLMTG